MAKRRSLERWKEMGAAGAVVEIEGELMPVKTRVHARVFFAEILERYEPRDMVTIQRDDGWLRWLLEGHYDRESLCPGGAWYFTVHSNRDIGHAGNAKGFSVVPVGSTKPVPFSMARSLRGVPKNADEKLELAMREVVAYQVAPAWHVGADEYCPVTEEKLKHESNIYVHYVVPMAQLLQEFFDFVRTGCVPTTDERDCGDHFEWDPVLSEDKFENEELLERWRVFHDRNKKVLHVSVVGHFQLERERLENERREDAMRKVFMGLRTPLNYDPTTEVAE